MSAPQRNERGQTFEQWMTHVDRYIARIAGGLTSGDLADQPYYDMFLDEVPAKDAAILALEEEGFPFDEA